VVGRQDAMVLAAQQRKTRDGLSAQREAARAQLIETQAERAALTAETVRAESAMGPVRYIAIMFGTDAETAVRWLILLMVLCCDPAAYRVDDRGGRCGQKADQQGKSLALRRSANASAERRRLAMYLQPSFSGEST
jgi:hypothetical protein